MSQNVDDGVLDVHTNVYIYLTIRYGETFCGRKDGLGLHRIVYLTNLRIHGSFFFCTISSIRWSPCDIYSEGLDSFGA